MDPVSGFLIGVAVLLALASGALYSVHKPFTAILGELCGAEHRARFWARLYESSLLLLVFFFCLWSPPDPGDETIAFLDVLAMFRAGILGILLGLGILAAFTLFFIARYDRTQERMPPGKIGPDAVEPTA